MQEFTLKDRDTAGKIVPKFHIGSNLSPDPISFIYTFIFLKHKVVVSMNSAIFRNQSHETSPYFSIKIKS